MDFNSFPEHAELQQPKLLLRVGAERELPGPLHEDGGRDPAAGQRHHHPAARSQPGVENRHSELAHKRVLGFK